MPRLAAHESFFRSYYRSYHNLGLGNLGAGIREMRMRGSLNPPQSTDQKRSPGTNNSERASSGDPFTLSRR
jgi:hypothetical protein